MCRFDIKLYLSVCLFFFNLNVMAMVSPSEEINGSQVLFSLSSNDYEPLINTYDQKCQGLLESTSTVITAPNCVKAITEHADSEIYLLDYKLDYVGRVLKASNDITKVNVELFDSKKKNFPVYTSNTDRLIVTSLYPKGWKTFAVYVGEAERHLRTWLWTITSDEVIPPGSPVTTVDGRVLCIATGTGLCIAEVNRVKRQAVSCRDILSSIGNELCPPNEISCQEFRTQGFINCNGEHLVCSISLFGGGSGTNIDCNNCSGLARFDNGSLNLPVAESILDCLVLDADVTTGSSSLNGSEVRTTGSSSLSGSGVRHSLHFLLLLSGFLFASL